jgi:hypothetical protein
VDCEPETVERIKLILESGIDAFIGFHGKI